MDAIGDQCKECDSKPGMIRHIVFCFSLTAALLLGTTVYAENLSSRLQAFYYPWYGTPDQNGEYIHWRHDVLGDVPAHTFPGDQDIGADFFPVGGCYSSSDPQVLHRQMDQLTKAGIGVISVSWLGADSFEAEALAVLMDVAAMHQIAVNFHLEPAVQKSIQDIRAAIVYLIDTYGEHPAFYRDAHLAPDGLFYVYDSHNTPADQWARLLTAAGDLTIRGTRWNTAILGLLLTESDLVFIETSGMNGAYSYFAVDGFTYGSTSANWRDLVAWASKRGLLFVPSVGPGYSDQRIRPWNSRNWRDRESGDYYDCMFAKAIAADAELIGITSFNEWHEGTQIEPAETKTIADFNYLDYRPLAPEAYLQRTKQWRERWEASRLEGATIDQVRTDKCGGGISGRQIDHLALGCQIQVSQPFHPSYSGGSGQALVNGRTGSDDYRDGEWQGFEGTDLEIVLDLGVAYTGTEVRVGFLRDSLAWIFLPRQVHLEGASDGQPFVSLDSATISVPEEVRDPLRYEISFKLPQLGLRKLRFNFDAQRTCPPGHPGAGKPAWLFIDEIQALQPN